ncbi:MAG: tetratricopeptide repeat protein [Terriglobia bacterium]
MSLVATLLMAVLLAGVSGSGRGLPAKTESGPAQGRKSQQQGSLPILERAQQSIAQGKLEEARKTLLQGLKTFPHEAALHNFLGVVDAEENNNQSAEEYFHTAIQEAPHYSGAYLNLGHLYQAEIKKKPAAFSQALATYQKLLQFDPTNVEANYQAALLQMQRGRFEDSLDHLSRLPAGDQQKPQILALLCVDRAGNGKLREAGGDARRLITSPGLTEEDVVSILPELKAHGPLALQLLEGLNQRHLASVSTQNKLGILQEQTGRLKEARQTLDAVAEKEPNDATPLVELARVANQQQDYRGALGYLAHARALEPQNAAIHFFFGMICVEMDLHQEAYVSLKKAVDLDPDDPYYNYALGAVLSQREDPRESIRYFKKYCALEPADPRGDLALGAAYYYAHDLNSARSAVLKVAHSKLTAAGANYFLGRIANDEGNWSEAVQYLQVAVRDDSDYADAYAMLGSAYLNQKAYGEAEKALLRALHIEPANYLANLNLMVLYQRTKDERAAAQARRFAAVRGEREQRAKLFLRTIRVVP